MQSYSMNITYIFWLENCKKQKMLIIKLLGSSDKVASGGVFAEGEQLALCTQLDT